METENYVQELLGKFIISNMAYLISQVEYTTNVQLELLLKLLRQQLSQKRLYSKVNKLMKQTRMTRMQCSWTSHDCLQKQAPSSLIQFILRYCIFFLSLTLDRKRRKLQKAEKLLKKIRIFVTVPKMMPILSR